MVKMWNLQTNQQQQIAQHAAPVRHCFYVKDMNMLVTGSWDKVGGREWLLAGEPAVS